MKAKTIKKFGLRLALLAAVGAGGWYGYKFFRDLPQRQEQVATTKVRKGDVIVRSFARGELRAVRSATLTAPNLFGTVQVTRMAALGSFAREKDLVIEFDDSEVNSRVEEKELEIEQVDEQIKKNTADLEIRSNQDQVELLSARYAVRRAELEVKRNELLSAIDAKKNELTLQEAQRRLKQLESDIRSRQEQARAQLAVFRENRNRATLELQREKARLMQVKLLSPMSGLVAIRQNRTGFMFPGMQIPDIREGDQVQPGIPVADILDLSEVEVVAKVGELDRANLKEGQDATLALDALPEKKLKGRIKSMSGTASANTFSFDPAKKFDVVFSVDMRELLTALGAKPDQVVKILATAEANRKKGIPSSASGSLLAGMDMGGAPGGMMMMTAGGPGGGAAGGMSMAGPGGMQMGGQGGPGGEGGGRQGGMRGGFGGGGGGGFGAMRDMSPEQQQKVRDAIQKAMGGKSPQDMTPEERSQMMPKIQAAIAEVMKQSGGAGAAAGAQRGERGGENQARGERGGERRQRGEGGEGGQAPGAAEGGPRRLEFAGGPGGPGGFGGRGGGGGGRGMFGGATAPGGFNAKDLEAAKLPPPPEEDSQFDVLLRPGLLADVEIIVEKIPDALNVPMQAIFEREGKPVVYVKAGNRFEPRFVTPLKRSESVMVIAQGLQAGETVALSDPTASKSDDKKKKGDGGAMGALPGGGKK